MFSGSKNPCGVILSGRDRGFQEICEREHLCCISGLVPEGEDSSSDSINRLPIAKAGNSHLRKLLTEASGGMCKGQTGHKSKDLKARQYGNPPEVIAYADKANERLRRKYYRMIRHGKKRNIAVTAVARELACFIWGMMTDKRIKQEKLRNPQQQKMTTTK